MIDILIRNNFASWTNAVNQIVNCIIFIICIIFRITAVNQILDYLKKKLLLRTSPEFLTQNQSNQCSTIL